MRKPRKNTTLRHDGSLGLLLVPVLPLPLAWPSEETTPTFCLLGLGHPLLKKHPQGTSDGNTLLQCTRVMRAMPAPCIGLFIGCHLRNLIVFTF